MAKKRWAWVIGAVMVATLLGACGSPATPVQDGATKSTYGGELPPVAPTMVPAPAPGQPDGGRGNASLVSDVEARKVIQTASLKITVKDTAAVLDAVQSLAKELGGYVVTSNAWRETEQLRAQVTLRVPADQLQAALQRIRAQAIKVDAESISGEDVTQEYTDIESRLRNLRATEKELLELLTTAREKTGKTEDVLAIFRELTQIREQIEMLQGRQQYLDTMTAMATISVDIWPEPLEKPIVEPGWKPLKTLRDAFRALTQTGQVLVDGLIWLVVYGVPVLALIAAPVVLIVWAVRRSRRRKAAPSQ
ncbi:MAG: DUF4349 domain-containing protein [Chloroflexi bacterium]|nr:DUF4349 domain-containing protein [Chloroflexota bacterium]